MTDEPEMPERFRALVPGRRYRVTLDDCCLQGWFVGTFERFAVSPDLDGTPFVDGLVFDVGQIGPDWGAFKVEPE